MTGAMSLGHLYVSDFLNDTVDAFSISSSTGALTPASNFPFSLVERHLVQAACPEFVGRRTD